VEPSVTLLRVPHGGLQPETLVDTRGVLHVVYFSGDPRHGDIFYVRSTDDGSTFSNPLRVNSEPGSAIAIGTIRGAQLAVAPDGRVHVVWNGSDRARQPAPAEATAGVVGMPVWYARSDAGATRFERQRNLTTRTVNVDGGGSIAVDRAGIVYVAWHANHPAEGMNEDTRRVWLATSRDEGVTFGTELPVWDQSTGVCGCCSLRLFSSASRTLHLLYRSAHDLVHRDVYWLSSTDEGATFRGRRVQEWNIGACPMTSMSIADGADTLLAAWETEGEVYFAPLTDTGISPQRPPSSRGRGRKHPRVIAGRSGTTLLVWVEGTAWARGGAVAWQLYDPHGKNAAAAGVRGGVPAWSFAAGAARPDGSYLILY
jgi:hypothetical protein